MENRSTDELVKMLWDYNHLHQKVKHADVIIGLGSNDMRTVYRCVDLYLQGYAPIILFSGGFGRLTGNWIKPEAEMYADAAIKAGVPHEKILIENKSTNTAENIKFSMLLLAEKGIKIGNVILVHRPYMERRQYATWQKLFPDIRATVTSPLLSFDEYVLGSVEFGISKEDIINTVVADTQRIKLYPQRGFMVAQEIPDQVWQAYLELLNRGYAEQLVNE